MEKEYAEVLRLLRLARAALNTVRNTTIPSLGGMYTYQIAAQIDKLFRERGNRMRPEIVLEAIRARINGERDNPCLEMMGALRTNPLDDILAWTEEAISEMKEED